MLSQRLSMILSLIKPCKSLVDIGSDHGYLALSAYQKGIVNDVIATDLRPQPLIQTQKTFAQANVFEHVTYILSDGLKAVSSSVDCAVITGMGADLIIRIIKQDIDRFKAIPQIITQANTKLDTLRKEMTDLGFIMNDERIVFDGFYYIAQSYHFTLASVELNEVDAHLGQLLSIKDPIYLDYLYSEKIHLENILKNHPHSKKHLYLLSLLKSRLNERLD